MSRAKIGAVVAVIVVVLTGAAYLLATRRLEAQVARDVELRVSRAQDLFAQIGAVESLNLITRAQEFSRDEVLQRSLAAPTPAEREQLGGQGIQHFLSQLGPAPKPDFTALVDTRGAVVVADTPLPDSDDLKSHFKSVAAALDSGQISKDIWAYGNRTVRVAVAPVVAPQTGVRLGAVILGYALTNKEAIDNASKLGADVVFFSGERIVASSFARSPIADLKNEPTLLKLVNDSLSGKNPDPVTVELAGETWVADAGPLSLNFSDRTTGAIVFESLSRGLDPLSTVRTTILLLGVATLLVALLTMVVTSRLILHQAEEIEAGVTEIINGDADYTFHPVGSDLDGLASSLNVMLARILGRPDPGDEPLDDGTGTGKVILDDEEAPPAPRTADDPESMALASEPEAQYYRRIYDEYIAARKAAGETFDNITYESFTAKLRLNEANLKKKYNCKMLRFRVVSKGNQVSLKPVPIL